MFENVRITRTGGRFHQCYALLSEELGPEVLEPKKSLEEKLIAQSIPGAEQNYVMIGRFGSASDSVHPPAAVVSGEYMPLENHPGSGMGAVGQAVTHQALRGQGHGTSAVALFEAAIAAAAAARGEKLQLMILESKSQARNYWVQRGYRYPLGTEYTQPPMDYDKETGIPLYPAMPELLMVKVLGAPNATEVERSLLVDAVRTLYHVWYIPDQIPDAARPEVEENIQTLFEQFLASLPTGDGPIPLGAPPT
jgi:GNAT superfamily N-acetyltransferase